MTDEAALAWFLEDAKRQGLTVREYEARYGILLMPAQRRIAAHETPMSEMPEGWQRKAHRVVGHEIAPADDADGGERAA
jgi:hypothetical protein